MKRDMGLVRRILIEVEARNDLDPRKVEMDGVEPATLARHVEMLVDAGFLEGIVAKPTSQGGCPTVWVTDLSWSGHDFAAALENSTVWGRLKGAFSEAELAGMPLSVMRSVLLGLMTEWAKQKVGLSGGG